MSLDGIYVRDGDTLRFEPAPAPDASNAPPSQSPAEALASAGMQRGTLLTVRESGDGSQRDDAGLAPPQPRRVTDGVTHERFNLHASVHLKAHDDATARVDW